MKVITLINEKGGVGKTTVAIHLAAGLALRGFRVLIIDGDAQANATVQLGLPPTGALYNIIVKDKSEWKDCIIPVPPQVWKVGHAQVGELYITPGNIETRAIPLVTENTRALYDRLQELSHHLDYVIIDTSPTPSLTHAMFYVASDYLIIPTEAQALSIRGVANTFHRLQNINENRQANGFKPLELLGVVINKFRTNTNAHVTGQEQLQKNLGKAMMMPVIIDRTIWRDREYFNQTLFTYEPDSIAAAEIWEVVDETIKRTRKSTKINKATHNG